MKIVLVGMSHRTAPLALRERLSRRDPVPALEKLAGFDEIEEAVLLSTCNRIEVVAVTRHLDDARHRLRGFFRHELAGDEDAGDGLVLESCLYEHLDAEAMRHVFRVVSALDSMVVGEPQILGQAKDAYRAALECGACGPILGRLFQHGFSTAKRVRSETRVAVGTLSVARVAVDLARQIFENFADKRALLIGAGEMTEAALEALRADGLRAVHVVNRTPERAEDLAVRFGATAHGLDELPELLSRTDVVLTSIDADRPLLTEAILARAVRGRPHRPIFVIDIGVPRNAEPEIHRLDNVYLYDIDDLVAVADDNAEQRRRETVRAEAIVVEEQQRFDGWFAALRAVPTIRHLRARVEAIRSGELERALARLDLSGPEREGVESLTHSIVNKILHAPLSRLRREAQREEGMAYLEAARVLFDLDSGDDAPDENEAPDGNDTPDGPADA